MKTTIELPDSLYRRLKTRAVESGMTIREIVRRGVEHELEDWATADSESHAPENGETAHSHIDEYGWPVLTRPAGQRGVVTEQVVNRLREKEGV